ncbi:MAG: hydroxymethylpyrimidine/phosphomethylpyrimidine kinase, partial [Bdellovibrionales bacterium]|nr:hydroxymethylpyrimidine/phosphomethylpyrimidine kinase [Bdellovibrionales bacterium]
MKIAWSIAGSDPSGFAGLHADLRAFEALGVHGMAAVSALSSQNPSVCESVSAVGSELLVSQLHAMRSFAAPSAIKTGLLGSEHNVRAIAQHAGVQSAALIVDPVCMSSTGFRFMDDATLEAYKRKLLPIASLVTPNLPESVELSGQQNIKEAASYFLNIGSQAVLIKGGHRLSDWASDFFSDTE